MRLCCCPDIPLRLSDAVALYSCLVLAKDSLISIGPDTTLKFLLLGCIRKKIYTFLTQHGRPVAACM